MTRLIAAQITFLALSVILFVSGPLTAQQKAIPEYRVAVVHTYPHDRGAFTQGLEYHQGMLYESTGLEGRSTVRLVELATGRVVHKIDVPAKYFGEGITVINGKVVEITWVSHKGFVYGETMFDLLQEFAYPGEGWGLANDGKQIYMSDGTPEIRVLDPRSLKETRRISVHAEGLPVQNLNELEWIHGEIWANIWQSNRIARISPADGRVVGWIDASGLLNGDDFSEPVDVLNGIAYDAANNRIFLTGKLWPKLFEVRLTLKRPAH